MHTVSTYPMEDEFANLKMIETLRKNIIVMLVIVDMKWDWLSPMPLPFGKFIRKAHNS